MVLVKKEWQEGELGLKELGIIGLSLSYPAGGGGQGS